MPFHVYMGWAYTHRICLMCSEWLHAQWNIPDRHDHYTMGVMCQVARVLSQNPNSIQLDKFRLIFQTTDKEINEEEERKHLENSKAMRIASLGGFGRMTKVDEFGNVIEPAKETPRKRNIIPSKGTQDADNDRTGGIDSKDDRGYERVEGKIEGSRDSIVERGKGRRRV